MPSGSHGAKAWACRVSGGQGIVPGSQAVGLQVSMGQGLGLQGLRESGGESDEAKTAV